MAKKQAEEPTGRYVVERVPTMLGSAQAGLQQKLDEGDAKGWTLRHVVPGGEHWVLVVWERPL